MDYVTVSIALMIVGLILLIIEAMSPGFFAIIPGTILVVIGAIGYFMGDEFYESWMLFATGIAVAIVVSIGTIKLYQVLAKPEPPTTTVTESMIGREGVVVVEVTPNNIKGKVKIDNDVWSATSESVIGEGETVHVYDGEGVHLKVSPITK